MTVVWLRLYLCVEALGFFGVDKATVSRNTKRVLAVLRRLEDATLGWPEPPKRGEGKNVEQAMREHPDLPAIVDATEQSIQRPSDDEQQKVHYSGKKSDTRARPRSSLTKKARFGMSVFPYPARFTT